MRRKIDAYLDNWKNKSKNCLIVYGARQVGKSYSIDEYIEKNFDNHIKIDFSKDYDAIGVFESFKGIGDLYNKLSLYGIKEGENSVIFFDEIQELYSYRDGKIDKDKNYYLGTTDLISLSKALAQDGKYRCIFSGSLLGVTLNSVLFNPTGYMDMYQMMPMDFEEYLWANNVGEQAIKMIEDCFDKKVPVNEGVHNMMNKLFNEYVIIGGMPKAVKTYVETKNMYEVSMVQEGIINYYKADIIKYAPKDDRLLISEIYDSVSSELNDINKRFVRTHLDIKNIKNLDLTDKFLWLVDSGVALPVYNITEPKFPLKNSEDRKVLKLFDSDSGLLSYKLLGTIGRIKFLSGEIEVNFGANFENVVAQELYAHGLGELHYYNSKKKGEVDFVIDLFTTIIPIEVKSGKSGENKRFNHNALNNLMTTYENLDMAYVLSKDNLSIDGKIINLPIYMIMFIRKN